jgi:hypothetical protein
VVSQFSGFVPINFRVAGIFLLIMGTTGLILVSISAITGWFALPSAVLITSLAAIPVSLYLFYIATREKTDTT